MSNGFLDSKKALYQYIDTIGERNGWSEQMSSHAKAKIRGWLGRCSAPADDVAAFTHEAELTDEQSDTFSRLLNEKIQCVKAENGECRRSNRDPSKATNVHGFSLSGQMRHRPRLSKQETAATVQAYRDQIEANQKLNDPNLEIDIAEKQRLKAIVEKGKEAQEALIASSWGIVVKYVRDYAGNGVSEDDLMQEGTLAIIRAMETYIPEKSAFSTYATPWIRKSIKEAVVTQGRTIPMPPSTDNFVKMIHRAESDHEVQTGTTPASRELSQITGYSVKRIDSATRHEQQSRSISIETLVSNKADNIRILDTVEDPNAEAQYDRVLEESNDIDLLKVLHGSLSSREEKILLIMYGFEDGQTRSMSDIGIVLGYTKENIRQIKKKAVAKLGNMECLKRLERSSIAS